MARKKPPHEQNPADPKNWKHVTIKAGDVRVRPPLDWGDVDTLRVRLRREIHETPGRDLKLRLLDEWRMGLERRTRDTGRPDELQALWDDWTRIRGMVLGPEYRVSTAISPKPTKDINAPPSEDERQEPKCDLVPWPREDKTVGFAKLAEHVGKMEKQTFSIREAAAVLGVSADTVRAGVRRGQLPSIRIGNGRGRILIPRAALDAKLRQGDTP